MLEILRYSPWENPIMECQVGRFRDIHWEIKLVNMVELRKAHLVKFQVGRLLASFRDIHWEAPMMEYQVGRLMDHYWESHLVHNMELM